VDNSGKDLRQDLPAEQPRATDKEVRGFFQVPDQLRHSAGERFGKTVQDCPKRRL
jgi:hypothetical protein